MHSTSSKTLLISVLLLVVALAAVLGYEIYAINYENIETAALASQVADNAKGTQIVGDLKAIQMNDTAELNFLQSLAVSKSTLVPFLELVEKTGSALNLKTKISTVSVDQGKTASTTANKLHVTLSTEGDWANSFGFVHALENLPYRVMIDQISLATDLTEGTVSAAKPVWRSNIILSLYSFE